MEITVSILSSFSVPPFSKTSFLLNSFFPQIIPPQSIIKIISGTLPLPFVFPFPLVTNHWTSFHRRVFSLVYILPASSTILLICNLWLYYFFKYPPSDLSNALLIYRQFGKNKFTPNYTVQRHTNILIDAISS